MPFLMTDMADGQKAALQMQYAPQEAKNKAEMSSLDLAKAKREEEDVKSFADKQAEILGRTSTPPDAPKDTRGGYEDPEVTKLNDVIQKSQAEAQTHLAQKQQLVDLAKAAAASHNPGLAEKYRAQADDFDDKARDSAEAAIKATATRDEAKGRYASGYLAGPKNDSSWAQTVLGLLTDKLITGEEAYAMGNVRDPSQREAYAKKGEAQSMASKTRATMITAFAKMKQSEELHDKADTFKERRVALKEREDVAKRANEHWAQSQTIRKEDLADAKESHSILKDNVASSTKLFTDAEKWHQGLLKDRADLQTKLAMNVDDTVIADQLKEFDKALDQSEVRLEDYRAAMKEDISAERSLARKLGVPAATTKSPDGINNKAEFDKAVAKLQHPPAGKPAPTASDIAYVKAHPEMAKQFEAHFGVKP